MEAAKFEEHILSKPAFIDDDPSIVRLYSRFQNHYGSPSMSTSDPAELYGWVERGEADCVISDLRMGGISGVDVLTRVHEIDPGMPLILLTGFMPLPEEKSRLDIIGAIVKRKSQDLIDTLESFLRQDIDTYSVDMLEARQQLEAAKERERSLSRSLRPYATMLLSSLESIENKDTVITKGDEVFTVGELISEVSQDEIGQRGLYYIQLIGETIKTAKDLMKR